MWFILVKGVSLLWGFLKKYSKVAFFLKSALSANFSASFRDPWLYVGQSHTLDPLKSFPQEDRRDVFITLYRFRDPLVKVDFVPLLGKFYRLFRSFLEWFLDLGVWERSVASWFPFVKSEMNFLKLFFRAIFSRFFYAFLVPSVAQKKVWFWSFFYNRFCVDGSYFSGRSHFLFVRFFSSLFLYFIFALASLFYWAKLFFLFIDEVCVFVFVTLFFVLHRVFLILFRSFIFLVFIFFSIFSYFLWFMFFSFTFLFYRLYLIRFILSYVYFLSAFCFRVGVSVLLFFCNLLFLLFFFCFGLLSFFLFCFFMVFLEISFLFFRGFVTVLAVSIWVLTKSFFYSCVFCFVFVFYFLNFLKALVYVQLKGVPVFVDLVFSVVFLPFIIYQEVWLFFLRRKYRVLTLLFLSLYLLTGLSSVFFRLYLKKKNKLFSFFTLLILVLLRTLYCLGFFFCFTFVFVLSFLYVVFTRPFRIWFFLRMSLRFFFMPFYLWFYYFYKLCCEAAYEAYEYMAFDNEDYQFDISEPALYSWDEWLEDTVWGLRRDQTIYNGAVEPTKFFWNDLSVLFAGTNLFNFASRFRTYSISSPFYWFRTAFSFFVRRITKNYK